MPVTPGDVIGGIGLLVRFAELVAEQVGQTTAEVLAAAVADVERRSKDPTDETDPLAAEIDANLPDGASDR